MFMPNDTGRSHLNSEKAHSLSNKDTKATWELSIHCTSMPFSEAVKVHVLAQVLHRLRHLFQERSMLELRLKNHCREGCLSPPTRSMTVNATPKTSSSQDPAPKLQPDMDFSWIHYTLKEPPSPLNMVKQLSMVKQPWCVSPFPSPSSPATGRLTTTKFNCRTSWSSLVRK